VVSTDNHVVTLSYSEQVPTERCCRQEHERGRISRCRHVFKDLCLDASDHQALADWWCTALGYVRQADESPRPLDWPVPIKDPAGRGPLIWINPVPEPKSVKNRMHLDVIGDKAELLSLGATMVRARDEEIDATSKGQLAHRSALALADRLDTPATEFPGDHAGFISQLSQFAEVLYRLLTDPA
jgi:hypothetical protein